MKITSKKELVDIASEKNYRPEILEKIFLLLDLSSALMSVNFLNKNLVLKGGTAINLFCTENLPRLSVDLDINYMYRVPLWNIENKLIPILNKQEANIITTNTKNIKAWAENIINDCRNKLEKIIIFKDNEIEFLELLQNEGKICPELLTTDKAFCGNIKKHPLLLWRIKNR